MDGLYSLYGIFSRAEELSGIHRPELKSCPKYIVAGNHSMFSLWHHIDADLPFTLSKLLPYISLAELLEVRHQFNCTKQQISIYALITGDYDSTILPTLFNILDQAITILQSHALTSSQNHHPQ